MRIGLHTSISGSLEHAAAQCVEAGGNTFQIFSSSPRQWKASVPRLSDILALRRAREKHDLFPLVIHDSYLINLAAAEDEIRAKSVEAFRGELERALAIGAEYLVAHPGNHRGLSLEQGVLHVLESIQAAAAGLDTTGLTLLLENTAGAGTQLGGCFEELAVLRDYLTGMTELKVGFCIDTCHTLVSGYDILSDTGFQQTIADMDRLLGLGNIPVIHANDSKSPRGSHVDRHENIGKGYIGETGFRRFLQHPKLRAKAFILETPRETIEDARKDVEALKQLCRKSRTTTTKSS
ncbi:MAG: deoxyribonuclease IV [Bryobacteraceae bacterium]|nr:deoxyribonuclease IV [Bryobacteraceae bacterium]